MPWREIEEVLLDMDGTLLDLAFDNHFWTRLLPQRFGAARGLTEAEAMAELRDPNRGRPRHGVHVVSDLPDPKLRWV